MMHGQKNIKLPKVWQSRTAYNSFYRFLSQVKLMLSIQYDSIQVSRLLQQLLLIWHILGSFIMQHPTGCKNPEGNKHDFSYEGQVQCAHRPRLFPVQCTENFHIYITTFSQP